MRRDLAEGGVTEEELNRLREPQLKAVRDQQRQNGFWVNVLNESQSDPSSLDAVRQLEAHYLSITTEDLSQLARKYLTRENASWAVIGPEPGEEP